MVCPAYALTMPTSRHGEISLTAEVRGGSVLDVVKGRVANPGHQTGPF